MEPLGDVLNEFVASLRISRAFTDAGFPPRMVGLDFELRIPSGFVDLDRLVGGLARSSLMAIGGGPGQGKTALGVNIARHVSVRLDLTAVIFALAISRWQIARRFLSAESQVDLACIDQGRLSESDLKRLGVALDSLSRAPVFDDDTPDITASALRENASSLHADHPLDLIIIDQLMPASTAGSGRLAYAGKLSCEDRDVRTVKSLSRELKTPVLAFFETLPTGSTRKQEDARLELVPDALVQHCDWIALIDRADDDGERKGITDLHVVKNRDGPNGICSLLFMERTGRIMDLGEGP